MCIFTIDEDHQIQMFEIVCASPGPQNVMVLGNMFFQEIIQ